MKHLYDDLYLGTDEYNYILYKRGIYNSGKLKGSEKFTPIGYYGTNLRLLFVRLMELKTHEHIENEHYDELLKVINEILQIMKKALKE